jgi:uncharacterized protein (TIGR00369 family)
MTTREPAADAEDARRGRVERIFADAAFVTHLGIRLDAVGEGWCATSMEPSPAHLQQHGWVHAGVVTTLADHTAGGAARAATAADQDVLTIELKINFLRAARAGRLVARGRTLRAGRRIIVAESEVFSAHDGEPELVAKCISTLVVIPQKP